LGGDSGDGEIVQAPPQTTSLDTNQDLLDLLGGLDSEPGVISENKTVDVKVNNDTPVIVQNNNNNNILNALNSSSDFLADPLPISQTQEMIAYDKSGLRIEFSLQRLPESPNTTVVNAVSYNITTNPFTEYIFQAAVPKTFQLQLLPPSGTAIPAGGFVTQVLRITTPNKSPLRMRIRVSYNCSGATVTDQAEVNNFPSELWQ